MPLTKSKVPKWVPADVDALPVRTRRLCENADEAMDRYGPKAARVIVRRLLKAGATRDQVHTLLDGSPLATHADVDLIWTDLLANESAVINTGSIRLTRASSIKRRKTQWGWQDRMPVGAITLLPGREGIGKSTFLAWLTAQLTKGTLPGEFQGQPRAVLYACPEDSWEATISGRMEAAGADLDLVYRLDTVPTEYGSSSLVLPRDCEDLARAAKKVNAAAIMLDPILSVIGEDINVNQSHQLRRALEPLKAAAEEARVIVPALAHFNKSTGTDILSKIPGARAWAEVARAAIALVHDPDTDHTVVSQVKNNLGTLRLPHLTFKIESVEVQTEDGPDAVGRIVWGDDAEDGAEEILERKPGVAGVVSRPDSQSNMAVRFVQNNGRPMKAHEVADEVGMSPVLVRQALKRAADKGMIQNIGRGLYAPLSWMPRDDD